MNDIIEHNGGMTESMSMVQHLAKAEIDLQIATAHAYPRSLSKISRNVLSLVTLSTSAAEKCTYALPRGGKPITGPSIRLAEIVASQWGNSRIGARVVHVDKKEMYVEAEGIFHDLETNTATTARVRRRISNAQGRLFSDDMIIVTGNAACSIAKRNAILGGVPEAIWGEAYDAALRTVRGDMKTLPERRDETLKAMAAFGLTHDQVYMILGIGGEKDFNLDNIATLRSTYHSLKNGEVTVEELLKTVEGEQNPQRRSGSIASTPRAQTQTKPTEERKPAENKPDPEPEKKGPTQAEIDAENKRKEDDAEIARLQAIYEDLAGEKPSGRWGIPALTQNIEEVRAEIAAKAEKSKAQQEETPHDPENGEVREDKPAATTTTQSQSADVPSTAELEKAYNDIVNDLLDTTDVDGLIDMFSDKIEQMKEHNPNLYNQLQAEIAEARE